MDPEWLRELEESNQRLSRILQRLRARELAWRNMTPAERVEYQALEREMQADFDDYNMGRGSGDWTA